MYSIIDYGAEPNQICTEAIQRAIDAADKSHDTVLIPNGIFISGTLNLKGASLYINRGGILKASGSITDYQEIGFTHNEMGSVKSFLFSFDHNNITIDGPGMIDLNARSFYDQSKPDIPQTKIPMTIEQKMECTRHYDTRPNQPICFINCKRLTIQNIKIFDAPCWSMSFISCKDVRVLDLTIENSMTTPNSDGMHFCCCDTVTVRGCHIDSGDDCIAITGITDWNTPCQHVTVSDCILHSASKAISIGYMHSIIKDIVISNCIVTDSNRGLVIMSNPGTGLVENVLLSNLRLDARSYAGNWWGNGEPLCFMGTSHTYSSYLNQPTKNRFSKAIRNVCANNLILSGENAVAIVGENKSIENIRISNFVYKPLPARNINLKGNIIDLSPGEQNAQWPNNDHRYWLYIREAENITINNYITENMDGTSCYSYVKECNNCNI